MTKPPLALRLSLGLIACVSVALPGFAQGAALPQTPAPHTSGTPAPAVAGAEHALPVPVTVDSVVGLVLGRNAGMQSYSAAAHLDLRQVNFPYLHPVLDGHEYLSAPGYIVFDYPHTPFYLKGITKVQGGFGDATRWQRCYNITLTDNGDSYQLHMVPKIEGEIAAVDMLVGRGGEINHVDWYYHENLKDHIRMTQTYSTVNGYSVVTQQMSEVALHHIRARGTQTFSAFQFNIAVPTPTPTPSNPLHACDN